MGSVRVLLAGFLVSAVLAGCTTPSSKVQVVDRNNQAAPARVPVTSGQYRVQRGDTLYSIAFRYGWDWKALAARNNIAAPYTIRVGQIIRFDQQVKPGQNVAKTAPVVTTPATAKPNGSSPPVVVAPPASGTAAPAPVTQAQTPIQPVTRSTTGWAWPANGPLIGKFSSNGSLNKGIDIAGELGQPVLAASDGSVVYAGSGLRGYGELVIIKHSDTYVSAYGHNRRLLVREGQQVKAGQTIAEMGSTGADRVKLHFEIRRQGKPVDPLQYLPNR
ncbi:peptidoglycan DD-metalloendopeptidase family protein [Pseudomonas sp. UL073]|uniref:Peptidoglycan DD-metalloendopeptidase family protein n=1 Tax=Zestomonas insulae TaxID=2809017 RepID=A0ABS2IBZ0_9GAMM|nr:peptidoglycan DD-metalloendopeptidase family protein [Pseudomonas insulae]MBM7059819.1 peptidoglycan DD-metalloendopeptidase family protein [Pseudomonas insulae]